MRKSRRSFKAEFKAKLALEAIQNRRKVNELASRYELHPTQITEWKKQALEGLPSLFEDGRSKRDKSEEELKARLYQQIGQLQVELDWLKKTMGADA
jgi:transposase-like protein